MNDFGALPLIIFGGSTDKLLKVLLASHTHTHQSRHPFLYLLLSVTVLPQRLTGRSREPLPEDLLFRHCPRTACTGRRREFETRSIVRSRWRAPESGERTSCSPVEDRDRTNLRPYLKTADVGDLPGPSPERTGWVKGVGGWGGGEGGASVCLRTLARRRPSPG